MADGTRMHSQLDDCFTRLPAHDEQLSAIGAAVKEILNQLSSLQSTSTTQYQHHTNPEGYPSKVSSGGDSHTYSSSTLFRSIKLEIPKFNGDDPHGWIFTVDELFGYYNLRMNNALR